jgi:hypothetical protein
MKGSKGIESGSYGWGLYIVFQFQRCIYVVGIKKYSSHYELWASSCGLEVQHNVSLWEFKSLFYPCDNQHKTFRVKIYLCE